MSELPTEFTNNGVFLRHRHTGSAGLLAGFERSLAQVFFFNGAPCTC
jgi:hypothetical protein